MSCCCNTSKGEPSTTSPLAWFEEMIPHCYAYATEAHAKGTPIVGILCEYTPREIIMAAGGIPVCLCGGDGNKIAPAEEELPANLCPLIKSTYGYCVTKTNPFLEMASLIVAETTCDGKKKMYERLAEHHPLHLLELPQQADKTDALDLWTAELHRLAARLEADVQTTITTENLRNAVLTMNRERSLRRELAALLQQENPPINGRQLLDLKSIVSGIPADLEQYETILQTLRSTTNDCPQKRTRVLLTGVPVPHGAERVLNIIEESGGLVVCQENCTGLKPIMTDIDPDAPDLMRAIAEKYLHLPCSVMTPNAGRRELIDQLIADYKPDCVIDLIWQACITYDVESHALRSYIEETYGLPTLRIETDYSPSDSPRIAIRVQALLETASNR